ncbi:MAG: hypothetical protein KGL11_13290 [Alphaproteobacteria bacterium]|nr:hypothetical protein [Alphaproteobacteria bacterium]
MRDRWPVFIALTVSSLAVLATGTAAGLALSAGTQPIALALGAGGLTAASAGLLAVVRWMRDAGETYPDYRYRRAVAAGPAAFATVMTANDAPRRPAPRPTLARRPDSLGDNVIVFDPLRARRRKFRAL